jgi:cation diffusion facilitator family transporter
MSQSTVRAAEKQDAARKTTFASIAVNSVLMTAQIVVGVFAHSQALIADGIHSLSDLVSDFIVLQANRHSAAAPDDDHNYGHSRYETVASLFLGALLIAVGVGMLWRAGERITNLQDIPDVHASALVVAVIVLISKELLFRHMLRAAERVRSALLIANAWHARSDAASSLVVAIGIIGSMAGWRLLDPIAAAIVGFMVARMGWTFGWDAMQDLSDRALDHAETEKLRVLLTSTPGVRDVHELRTRKMGDLAIVDAHILVDPLISVSEGHYIAELARARLLTNTRVVDALIHVDPENDETNLPTSRMPTRATVSDAVSAILGARGLTYTALNLHYLSSGFDIDVTLPAGLSDDQLGNLESGDFDGLKRELGARDIRFTQTVRNAVGAVITEFSAVSRSD